jgi:hypothetical protein
VLVHKLKPADARRPALHARHAAAEWRLIRLRRRHDRTRDRGGSVRLGARLSRGRDRGFASRLSRAIGVGYAGAAALTQLLGSGPRCGSGRQLGFSWPPRISPVNHRVLAFNLLGFFRQNLDLSMGYTDKPRKVFSLQVSPLCSCRG